MKKMFLLAAGVLVLSGCGAATLDNGGSSETQSEQK
ncbi:D-ribose ABC transporter substrate-binding protein, partial [Listeria monocytogenes]|nr:D-ribose ABC transporter substrate-binding protein [Listeria monocytogenes]